MKKLEAFKRLIREEVRQVIREELKSLLSELKPSTIPAPPSYKKALKEVITAAPKKRIEPLRSSGDPIKDLLAETAIGMTGDDYNTIVNLSSSDALGFPQAFNKSEPQVVESVTDMIESVGPVYDINQVEINNVLDFSQLMQTLQAKGKI